MRKVRKLRVDRLLIILFVLGLLILKDAEPRGLDAVDLVDHLAGLEG